MYNSDEIPSNDKPKTSAITCSVVAYWGKTYTFNLDKTATVGDLKRLVETQEADTPTVKLIFGGRGLKDEKVELTSIITDDNPRFFANASQVHGGCACVKKMEK
jgi:hypothetical protein